MVKALTLKKNDNVLKEIGVTSKGGVYSFIPWDNTTKGKDDDGTYSVYKVGSSSNYKKRMENYFTSFPLGVYYTAFLGGCRKKRKRGKTTRVYYREIEEKIFSDIEGQGGKRIKTTHRVKNGGGSEWIYASSDMTNRSFANAKKEYGGTVNLFHTKHVNRTMRRTKKANTATFTAQITFPLSDDKVAL